MSVISEKIASEGVTPDFERELIKLLKGAGENLFLVCHVISGGIGDAVLFGKLGETLLAMPIIAGYNVFRIVTCYKDNEKPVREELKKHKLGGETHLIVCTNKETLIKDVQEYLAGESLSQRQLKDALKKPLAFLNISTRQMESVILPALGFLKKQDTLAFMALAWTSLQYPYPYCPLRRMAVPVLAERGKLALRVLSPPIRVLQI